MLKKNLFLANLYHIRQKAEQSGLVLPVSKPHCAPASSLTEVITSVWVDSSKRISASMHRKQILQLAVHRQMLLLPPKLIEVSS